MTKISAPVGEQSKAERMAAEIAAEMRALPAQNTPHMRAVRRKYSRRLKGADPRFVLNVADALLEMGGLRWVGYELIRAHPGAFRSLDVAMLERLGRGIDSWWTVDAFARTLSGPAWLRGQLGDDVIERWVHSKDPWWRRAALVSTVALNLRSQGGMGDVARTLNVCRMLAADHEDMVVKATSWALRELVAQDPGAVRKFLRQHEGDLAARVQREVTNKLATGLKSPKRRPIAQ